MILVSSALAADAQTTVPAGAEGAPSPIMSAAPLLLIFVVFYFLLIRPQQKKIKEHQSMIKALRRGDKVVTAGGVIGIIHKIEGDDVLVLEVAPEVKIRVVRDTVSTVLTKTVANDNKADTKDAE